MKFSRTTFFLGCLIGGIGASFVPIMMTNLNADTKLLPFQGRLTDASGAAIADGAKVVEFKMYDAPTGGNVKWAGEVHRLSVNGGLVNTMLGSKAGLGSVDFSTPSFLQIAVDANSDGQINAADPPLLPRQSIVPAVYASVAGESWRMNVLDSSGKPSEVAFGWDAVFTNGNPITGSINGGKLTSNSVTAQKFAPGAVTQSLEANSISSSMLIDGAVTGDDILNSTIRSVDIENGQVTELDLADNSVTWDKLSGREYFESASGQVVSSSAGGLAVSGVCDFTTSSTTYVDVPNLVARITVSRIPLVVELVPSANRFNALISELSATGPSSGNHTTFLRFMRKKVGSPDPAEKVSEVSFNGEGAAGSSLPCVRVFDTNFTSGIYEYTAQVRTSNAAATVKIKGCSLAIYGFD